MFRDRGNRYGRHASRLWIVVDDHGDASVTVSAGDSIPTETARPLITDPKVALDKLLAGNRRFVDAQMQHPARSTEHRLGVSAEQRPFCRHTRR